MIKGDHICVCFTEAPPVCLTTEGSFNSQYFSRYSPFGFEFSKKYIFEKGGRPVIYSPDEEYQEENKQFNWRHIRYDPTENDKRIDFTWEREWRLKTYKLKLDPNEVKLVLPNKEWIDKFIKDHEEDFHGSDCPECYCTSCRFVDFEIGKKHLSCYLF